MTRPVRKSEKSGKRWYQERGVQRRDALIAALDDLLLDRTISQIKYREIAARAGVPLPSCYNLFSSKLDLIQALAESYGPRFVDFVFSPVANPESLTSWFDLADTMIDRSIEFVDLNPATRAVWFGPDVPAEISLASRIRERSVAIRYKEFIASYYRLPEIENLDDIFYLALEMADRAIHISELEYGEATAFYVREAKRLQHAYLGIYIPPFIDRIDVNHEPKTR